MDITVEREGNTDRQPAPDVTPEPIFRVASEFVAARHLFVAKEVGLFEEVTEGPATLDELARRSGVPRAPSGSSPTPWSPPTCRVAWSESITDAS
jgi:hypothetical protein